jgi:heme exporter protein D
MENTQNASASSTPDLSASVNASKLANPATVVSPTPSANELAEGGDVAPETNNDGSHDWGQWIAIGIISLTIVSLVMQIVVNRRSLVRLNQDDKQLREDLVEVKLRVDNLEKNQNSSRRAA